MAEVADVVADDVAVIVADVVAEVAEVVTDVAEVVADHMADALTRMKTIMLLTWQKWQIQPTGTTSSIRLSQLLVSRPYSALASVLPGIQPAQEKIGSRAEFDARHHVALIWTFMGLAWDPACRRKNRIRLKIDARCLLRFFGLS